MNKLIYDEKIIEEFVKILPDATPLEQYFLSLSSRQKYLTQEERDYYGVIRAEMFAQTMCNTKDKIIKSIKKMETNEEAFLTRKGFPIPSKTLVCYINLFCCSTMKAIKEFNSIMNNNLMQLTNNAINKLPTESQMKSINKAQKTLIDCYQRAIGTNKFIDIDFDIPKNFIDYVNLVIMSF